MMRALVGWSTKARVLMVAIAVGLIALGVTRLPQTPVDTLPEFRGPTVEVQTEALGLSAEEVEQLVTVPLEQDLLNGVAFLEEIESVSLPGLSSVVMRFEPGTDILDARQVVSERLTQAVGVAGLPHVSKPPQMLQPLSSTSRVAMVKLTSTEQSPIEMSVLSRWVITPRLLGVEGVANVAMWGFRDRQLQVLVDPETLRERGLTLNEVVRTTGNALEVSPLSFLEASAPGTGGWIDTVNQRLHVFHEQAIDTPDELAQVTLEREDGTAVVDGGPVTLGDIATVTEDHQPLIGDAHCRGAESCLMLVIEKFPDANTPEVAAGIQEALDVMRPGLGGIVIDTGVYEPAEQIERTFTNLALALLIAGLLLAVVLLVVFGSWRAAVIGIVAVAASVITAGLVLNAAGATANIMLAAGIVAGLAVIVDDVIADTKHVLERLREHAPEQNGASTWRLVTTATSEMRSPILYATFIAGAALVPIAIGSYGIAGAFLPSVALAYALAVAASLVVALTVTPALAVLLLRGRTLTRSPRSAAAAFQRLQDRVSGTTLGRPAIAIAVLAGLLVAGAVAVPFLSTELRPTLEERDVLVSMRAEPGTSLTRMNEVMREAVEEVGTLPGVENVGAHVGRAIQADEIVNVNSGELWVNIAPDADYQATIATIDETIDAFQEVSHEIGSYSDQRITEVLAGESDELTVRVYGENPEILAATAEDVRAAMAGVDGVDDARVVPQPTESTIRVEVDLDRAQEHSIRPGDVRRAASILLSGITAGNLFDEQKVFDVVVWGHPDIRQSEDDVRNLLLDTPNGGHVRLGDVADVELVQTPTEIRHHGVMSYMDVVADADGGDAGAVAPAIEQAITQVDYPLEYHAELLGGFADRAAARGRLIALAVSAVIAIFLIFQAAFGSWKLAAVATVALPLAVSGGVVAAAVTTRSVLLGSVVGFVVVAGLAARWLLVLVRRLQTLSLEAGGVPTPEQVTRGLRERAAPVLSSAVATIVVMAPFVLSQDALAFSVVRPMAVVIVGGVVSSVLVTLVAVPALFLRLGRAVPDDADLITTVIPIPDEPAPVTWEPQP